VLRLEQEAVAWLRDHVYVADVALGQFVTASIGASSTGASSTGAAATMA